MNRLNIKLYSPKDEWPEENEQIICLFTDGTWDVLTLISFEATVGGYAFEDQSGQLLETDEFIETVLSWGYLPKY